MPKDKQRGQREGLVGASVEVAVVLGKEVDIVEDETIPAVVHQPAGRAAHPIFFLLGSVFFFFRGFAVFVVLSSKKCSVAGSPLWLRMAPWLPAGW